MKSFTKRDLIMFLAGVQVFHTLTHIVIGFTNVLPLELVINWTRELNMWAIGINLVVTGALFYLLAKTK